MSSHTNEMTMVERVAAAMKECPIVSYEKGGRLTIDEFLDIDTSDYPALGVSVDESRVYGPASWHRREERDESVMAILTMLAKAAIDAALQEKQG